MILDFATSPATLQKGTIDVLNTVSTTVKAATVAEGAHIQGTSTGYLNNYISFPEQNDVWLSCTHYTADTTWDGQVLLRAGKLDLSANVMYIYSDNSERYEVYANLGGSWSMIGTIARIGSTRRNWNIHIVTGAAGVIQIYEGDSALIDWTGDLSDFTGGVERFSFGKAGSASSEEVYWSAIFAADEDTRPITMIQHTIDANGTHSDFLGGDFDSINDIGSQDDTTKLVTAGVDSKSTFQVSDTPAGYDLGYEVVGVGIKVRAAKGGVNSSDLKAVAVNGANESESTAMGIDTTLGGSPAGMIPTAPDGTAWDVAKINAAEIGLKAT